MTTTLKKEKVATREPEVVSFPPRQPNTRRILIGSATLIVLAGLVAIVVYFATRSSQEAPTSPAAQAQVLAPVANWTFPEMTPELVENVSARPYLLPEMAPIPPTRPYLLPEMWPEATEDLEVALVENWSYPEMMPESPTRSDLSPEIEQSGPR